MSTVCDGTPGTPATEICDGLDNDCDGLIDNGNPGGGGSCSTGLPGACDAGEFRCTNGGLVCESTTSGTNEICNGLDDDCDGSVDEDAVDALTWYFDSDGDDFGNPQQGILACTQPMSYVSNDLDCDDTDPSILECNTQISNDPVEVTDPSGNASITFPDVTEQGTTTVEEIPCALNQPDGFSLNTDATCYKIETTADSSTGEKIVCIRYSNSLIPLPTYLFQCESAGVQNCCAIPLNGGPSTCPDGWPPPPPSFHSQSTVPPDQLEICISTVHLSEFGFGELEDATDTDFDTVPDVVDNCPADFNPLQEDADVDGAGDVCDPPQVDDSSAADVFFTPSCYPDCTPSDYPINVGTLATWTYSLPPEEEIGEVVVSGSWGDVDSFDSSAPAELSLDGVLVAECVESESCWQEDGVLTDWSFSFRTSGESDYAALFEDGEAILTAIQNGDISLIVSDIQLKIYTRPTSSATPVGDINFDGDVDGRDLFDIISLYGTYGCGGCPEDLNGDDNVDELDIGIFAEYFGVFP